MLSKYRLYSDARFGWRIQRRNFLSYKNVEFHSDLYGPKYGYWPSQEKAISAIKRHEEYLKEVNKKMKEEKRLKKKSYIYY